MMLCGSPGAGGVLFFYEAVRLECRDGEEDVEVLG